MSIHMYIIYGLVSMNADDVTSCLFMFIHRTYLHASVSLVLCWYIHLQYTRCGRAQCTCPLDVYVCVVYMIAYRKPLLCVCSLLIDVSAAYMIARGYEPYTFARMRIWYIPLHDPHVFSLCVCFMWDDGGIGNHDGTVWCVSCHGVRLTCVLTLDLTCRMG